VRLGICFSPAVSLAVPTYLPADLPTYSICCHLILSLHPTRLYLSPTALPLYSRRAPQPCAPTKSRERIPPPSHPASAQHASTRRNRPSILTLCILLCFSATCTTNRRSGHNLNSPTCPNRLPTQFASAARLFCFARTGHPPTCLHCTALSSLLPASRLPVVHKHFLAAPPTTVSCCRPHTILAVSR